LVLSKQELDWAQKYWTAANYLAAASIYLKDNFLVEEPLKPSHIKDSLLGHWGTCPGINFIYTHLNIMIVKHEQPVLLLTGPGHGFAAILANNFLEGSLQPYYSQLTHDKAGMGNLIKMFCWPEGFPSHLNPGVPGCIHEGGELGYSLGTAFGAVLDNPDLIAACIVGDGEAETGPTATAWHSTKWLNPKIDGAVLPIVHINGFKISNPTVYGTMSDAELKSLFIGYGYEPLFVGPDHKEMGEAIENAYQRIKRIQNTARSGKPIARPKWPVILLRTPKGWTGVKMHEGHKVEGSFRSHQVPAKDCQTNHESLKEVEKWLKSYKPHDIFPGGKIPADLLDYVPMGDLRIGSNPNALGGNMRIPLTLPDPHRLEIKLDRPGSVHGASTPTIGQYLKHVLILNADKHNFRIFSPDELASNKLDAVLDITDKVYVWPTEDAKDAKIGQTGRVMEMLSEHTLQSWFQGYNLTGRHGIFPSYEAFLPIVDSMVSQYIKFIELSEQRKWRTPVPSLNYILTSVCWRQDHNGFSHQNPGFVSTLLNKAREEHNIRLYFPADANMALAMMDHSLRSTNRVNVIVADKQLIRQWRTYEQAVEQCLTGAAVWDFASAQNPDVVLAACGDYATQEALATIMMLRHQVPELRVQFVNVSELNSLGVNPFYPNAMDEATFNMLFPLDRKVVFTFHGYPGAVKQILFDRPRNDRFHVYGYIEKGTTTTPFDMFIRNNVSRYHLAMRLIRHGARVNPQVAAKAELLVATYESKILEHKAYILRHGSDPEGVHGWKWH
jgi:xylulose-5-phosphate/fructose-6-phosphate phosphoketolase